MQYQEVLSTRSRNRTGKGRIPLVFETSASTYSAIRAKCISKIQIGLRRYGIVLFGQNSPDNYNEVHVCP
jgi:hypothetical protein